MKTFIVLILFLSSISFGAEAQPNKSNEVSPYEAAKIFSDSSSIYTFGVGSTAWILKYKKNAPPPNPDGTGAQPKEIRWVANMFALDGDYIYYMSVKPEYPDEPKQALMKISKIGGQPSQILSGSILRGGEVKDFTLDGNNYYAVVGTGAVQIQTEVLKIDRQTLKATVVATQPDGMMHVAAVNGLLFWTNDYGSVKMISVADPQKEVQIIANHTEGDIQEFITDGQNIFWVNYLDQLKKYDLNTHKISIIVDFDRGKSLNSSRKRSLVTNGKSLYWIGDDSFKGNSYEGGVYKTSVNGGQVEKLDLNFSATRLAVNAKSLYFNYGGHDEWVATSEWQTDTWQQQYVGQDGYIYTATRSNTYPLGSKLMHHSGGLYQMSLEEK